MRKRGPAVRGRERKRKMRLPAILLAAAMVLAAVQIPGTAVRAVDLTPGNCSLTVKPYGEGLGYEADLPEAQVTVELYQVAGAVKAEGYDSYNYDVNEAYQDAFGEALSEKMLPSLTNKTWRTLAQKAARVVLGSEGQMTPTETAQGGEKIDGLDAGLYLLLVKGETKEVEVTDAAAGETQSGEAQGGEEAAATTIATAVQTSRYEYIFAPELISLPGKDPVEGEDGNGAVSTATPGDWKYEMTATLKPERRDRKGSLEIVKTFADQTGMTEPATFVFQVDAYLDTNGDGEEEHVYNNVVGMTFTSAEQDSVTLAEQIPVGARIVVTEVYSGASYEAVGGDTREGVLLSADEALSLTFTNRNDHHHRGGHGITNSFEHDSENGWKWSADPEQPGTETE